MRALGYCRCSTEQQANEGVSLEQQAHRLRLEAERRGWQLELVDDTASGKTLERPAMEDALVRLGVGEFGVLVATRLDRVSRTVGDFAELMARAEREGWALVILDPPVDLTTPFGKAMAHVAAAFAQLERELISQRTREGIAAAKRRGAKPGNPTRTSAEAIDAVRACKRRGLSDAKTAAELDSKGLRTANGRRWSKERVKWLRTCSPVYNPELAPPAVEVTSTPVERPEVQPTAPRPVEPAPVVEERVERLPVEPRHGPTLPGR
jgi:DNA invertase Pin-like site-specific DNA recombinase